jgi:hypothetical protein
MKRSRAGGKDKGPLAPILPSYRPNSRCFPYPVDPFEVFVLERDPVQN